ncbi:MAG: DNA polymerase III subunit gamma/tau [bacterium]|nr:DNA polymerase III subunit gamma/tau [bacterium]
MSLYGKYRPQIFADVVGQDHIVTTLEQAASQDKLAHAYLFAGSRGTGKTSVARILAKIIMARDIEDTVLKKQIISGVENGSIVDLLEIDAASNRSIDHIRDIVEKIQFSPIVAKSKVYIIDEVHMLTKEAFNALLKTLEEPPPYAYFILATTEINKIPTTIQSRCQCFPFRRIREDDIIRRLQYISDQEHISIDREALRAVASYVEGGMRDAISLLDQMRTLEKITTKDVEQRIGSTGHEYVASVFTAIESQDTAALLQTVRKIEDAGVSMDVFLRQLLTIIRKQLHETVANKKSTKDIVYILDVLLKAIVDVRIAPVPGLVLETALLSLCLRGVGKDVLPLKDQKEIRDPKDQEETVTDADEEHIRYKMQDTRPKEECIESKEVDIKSELPIIEARELSMDTLQEAWEDIVRDVTPASVKMSLKNAKILSLEDSKVTIAFTSAFHRDTVAKDNASIRVEEVMEKLFKRALRIECVIDADEGSLDVAEENVSLADAAAEVF